MAKTIRGEPMPLSTQRLLELADKEAQWLDGINHIEGSYATSGAADIIYRLIAHIKWLDTQLEINRNSDETPL